MSLFPEYERYDATGLAALIRDGEVAAVEVLDAAIERNETRNPLLNAVVRPTFDEARWTLSRLPAGGRFAGVPFLFKDVLQAYGGVPMSCGSAALRDHVPAVHSEYVRRALDAGLLPLGRSNVPEFGLMATTEPLAFGATRNPWELSRSPGGSSGGAAAAVSAGIVPMAGGNDGGGSIRIPAGWCGLFGLKPSRGRVPAGPYHGEVWDGAVCEHVLSRSVRDSAIMLDALRGPDPGAPYAAIAPRGRYADMLSGDPPPLRIGFCTRSPVGMPVERACREAVEVTAERLLSLGHHVEECEPAVDGMALAHAYLKMYYGQTAAQLRRLPRLTERPLRVSMLEDLTRALASLGDALSAADYCSARDDWNTAARAMAEYHRRFNLYLTPTAATVAPPLGLLRPDHGLEALQLKLLRLPGVSRAALALGLPERMAARLFAVTPFTQLANLTGQPAMSVPLHWTESGLPVGVHFMAANGAEDLLFSLAGQLERAHPWFHRRPLLPERNAGALPA